MRLDGPKSPWKQITGWRLERCLRDLMHNFHLGCGRDVAGSTIWELYTEGVWGALDATKALKQCWLECKAYCSQNDIGWPPRVFTVNMLGKSEAKNFACLESVVKAAHVKIIVRFLADFTYHRTTSACGEHAKVRATMLWALSDFLHTLDTSPQFMSLEQVERAARSAQTWQSCYQWLSAEALANAAPLWKMRPKAHYIAHQLVDMQATRENPRHQMCFVDEDFLGKVKRLASKCGKATVTRRALQRYILYMAVRWHEARSL